MTTQINIEKRGGKITQESRPVFKSNQMTTRKAIYRVNITTLSVESATVTELENERADGAIQVEVMPSGMLRSLDPLGYYAETEKEAAEMLINYIDAEVKKASFYIQRHEADNNAAKDRLLILMRRMRELALEGHKLPEGRENGV